MLKQAGLDGQHLGGAAHDRAGRRALDGEKVTDKGLRLAAGATVVLQVGKRKFARVTLK